MKVVNYLDVTFNLNGGTYNRAQNQRTKLNTYIKGQIIHQMSSGKSNYP